MLSFSSISLMECLACAIALQFLLLLWFLKKQNQQKVLSKELSQTLQQTLINQLHQLQLDLSQSYQNSQNTINEKAAQGQLAIQLLISDAIQKQMSDVREQISYSFKQHASSLTSHLQILTEEIRTHLHSLTQQVNHKLTEGFEKTSTTFMDVVKRLTIIDE